MRVLDGSKSSIISIHALLAESDYLTNYHFTVILRFLSTLSLRRATPARTLSTRRSTLFLSTLSLRRATIHSGSVSDDIVISIHALLAESDSLFYNLYQGTRKFLSTLSLRRATKSVTETVTANVFLSTLSLRRATLMRTDTVSNFGDFYPRSPCGERPAAGR